MKMPVLIIARAIMTYLCRSFEKRITRFVSAALSKESLYTVIPMKRWLIIHLCRMRLTQNRPSSISVAETCGERRMYCVKYARGELGWINDRLMVKLTTELLRNAWFRQTTPFNLRNRHRHSRASLSLDIKHIYSRLWILGSFDARVPMILVKLRPNIDIRLSNSWIYLSFKYLRSQILFNLWTRDFAALWFLNLSIYSTRPSDSVSFAVFELLHRWIKLTGLKASQRLLLDYVYLSLVLWRAMSSSTLEC